MSKIYTSCSGSSRFRCDEENLEENKLSNQSVNKFPKSKKHAGRERRVATVRTLGLLRPNVHVFGCQLIYAYP